MDDRDQLLHNEIQNLGQIIQTLSCELAVLQDFIKDHFGKQFTTYRQKYGFDNAINLKSAAGRAVRKGRRGEEESEMPTDNSNLKGELEEYPEIDEEVENYRAPCSEDELDPLSPSTVVGSMPNQQSGKHGRRQSRIWKFYDKIFGNGNKSHKIVSARCHICRGLVSPKAQRLVDHRIKCRMLNGSGSNSVVRREINIKPIKRESSQKPKTEAVSLKKSGQVEDNHEKTIDVEAAAQRMTTELRDPLLQPDNDVEMPDISTTTESTMTKCETETLSRSNLSNTTKKVQIGRAPDEVWQYFEVVMHNGLKKAKCNVCGHHVSPKADRMRSHKVFCGEVAD